jgi:hypothetical protein
VAVTKPVFTASFRWLAAGLTREEKVKTAQVTSLLSVLRLRIHQIHKFLGLLDLDPLVRGMDPDLSIIKQK